jgi:hypothetical protein
VSFCRFNNRVTLDAPAREMEISALISHVPADTDPGDTVVALDGDRDPLSEFLVLNGVETSGPTQLIELRFQ